MVASFGAYRLKIAFRSRADQAKAEKGRGLYSLPRRTHILFGVLYLLLGLFLVAAGLGWIRSPFASSSPAPSKDTTIEVDTGDRSEGPRPIPGGP